MATQLLSPEQLRLMFIGQSKTLTYDEAVRLYESLRVHADGDMPIWLIKKQRPNESDEVRRYREDSYEAETQNPIERVIGVFEKIHRSPDFMIRFDEEPPAIINPDETPEKYLTEKYPVYGSIENWLFNEALRSAAIDSNAVVAIIPKEWSVDNEYIQPIAKIFNAPSVVQFVAEDYCVLKSDELSSLLTPQQQQSLMLSRKPYHREYGDSRIRNDYYPQFYQGQVYYYITTDFYFKWEENSEGKYQATDMFVHGLGELPAFQMPGKFVKRYGESILKKAPLNPMVPHLNKAATRFNDLDAGVTMHLFLEKWRINNRECKVCKGTGLIPNSKDACHNCSGSGFASGKSPFNEFEINPSKLMAGATQLPIPPLGYVEKNPEILKVANDFATQDLYKALCSIQMEHLAEIQLNQSGVSKQYDRDEVNNFIYSFAENLIYILNLVIYFENEIRYKSIVPNQKDRKKMLPIIPVPEKFDVINTTFLLTEYLSGKTAGLNGIILSEMQKEIAQKKFYANPKVSDFVEMVMDLDPFPDKSIEEKALMLSNSIATEEDVILSSYISDFIKQALEKDLNFAQKTDEQKREVLLTMAKEKIDSMNTAKQLSQQSAMDIMGGGQPQPGQPQPVGAAAPQAQPQLRGNGVMTSFKTGSVNPNAGITQ